MNFSIDQLLPFFVAAGLLDYIKVYVIIQHYRLDLGDLLIGNSYNDPQQFHQRFRRRVSLAN